MSHPRKLVAIGAIALVAFVLAACDVEKQMDTMVDNPSFAEPLFAKFMARPEFQAKAIDTILADPGLRQQLLEKLVASPDYAQAIAEQLMTNPATREMVAGMLASQEQPPTP